MAEKVIVRGGDHDGTQFENAATEATLLRLLELIESGKLGSGGSSTAQNTQNLYNQAVANGSLAMKVLTTTVNAVTTVVKKLAGAVVDLVAGISKLAGYIIGTAVNVVSSFVNGLMSGSTKLSDFTKGLEGIPIIGLFHKLAVFLENNLNEWRKLTSVGAAFNNSISDMRAAAALAEMPLSEFSELIQSNSQALRLFGESSTTGAVRFAELSKELRTSPIGAHLMEMGMTMKDINESMISYLAIQAKMNKQEKLTKTELFDGTTKLAYEMDLLSKATGQSRKDIEKNLIKMMDDPRWNAMMSKLPETQQQIAAGMISAIENISPEMASIGKDTMDMVRNSMESRFTASLFPQLDNFFIKLGAGKFKDMEESTKEYDAAMQASIAQFKTFSPEILSSIQEKSPALYSAMTGIIKTLNLFNGNFAAMKEEQNARAYLTGALANFEQVVSSIRGKIELAILKSGVFNRLNLLIQEGGEKFTDLINRFVTSMSPKLNEYIDKFNKFLESVLTAEDPIKVIKDQFKSIGKDLAEWATTTVADTLSTVLSKVSDSLWNGFTNWIDNIFDFSEFKNYISKIGDSLVNVFNGIFDFLPDAVKSKLNFDTSSKEGSEATSGSNISGLEKIARRYNPTDIAEITHQLEALNKLPKGFLTETAEGIERLRDAIDKFTPGIMKSLMQNLSSMIGPNTIAALHEMSDAGVKVNYLAEALEKVNFNKLDISGVSFDKIEVGTKKIEALSNKLNGLKKSMDEVSTPTLAATLGDSLKKITVAIEDALPDYSESDKKQSAEIANLGTKLEQLNANVLELVRVQREALDDIKRTAKNTKNQNNLL